MNRIGAPIDICIIMDTYNDDNNNKLEILFFLKSLMSNLKPKCDGKTFAIFSGMKADDKGRERERER